MANVQARLGKARRYDVGSSLIVRTTSFAAALLWAASAMAEPTMPSGPPTAATGSFVTRLNAIVCANFRLAEAEAAVRARDSQWMKELGCVEAAAGIRLVPVELRGYDRKLRSEIRARAYPSGGGPATTVWIRSADVYSWIVFGPFPDTEAAERERTEIGKRTGWSDLSVADAYRSAGDKKQPYVFAGPSPLPGLMDRCETFQKKWPTKPPKPCWSIGGW